MIDLHAHTLLSDGVLVPSELARRAAVCGYKALAITDHADESNLELVLAQTIKVCAELNKQKGLKLMAGVELTHLPIDTIGRMVKKARLLGAALVVGHGETIAEPVAPGTNRAFINAGVDILAHPGLITPREASLAAKRSVHLEISTRKGHSLTNGHVGAAAKKAGAKMLVNSDAHCPGDLNSSAKALNVVLGAGLTGRDFKRMQENAGRLLKKN